MADSSAPIAPTLPTAKRPVPPQLAGHLFTSANAAQMARKRHAADRAASALVPPHTLQQKPAPDDPYIAERLLRVRRVLDLVDEAIEKAVTSKDLRRLACLKELTDSQSKLEEQERRLSGRPLPGSRRPGPERGGQRRQDWTEPAPLGGPAPGWPSETVVEPARPAAGPAPGWEYDDPASGHPNR